MIIQEANERQLNKWDDFVDKSINGTIFHKIKFLKYHKDKFADKERFLVVLKGEEVVAQISVALFEENGKIIAKSPYGASYGGFVLLNQISYEVGKEIVELFIDYLKELNVSSCVVTHPISSSNLKNIDIFYFNLLEKGFRLINRDISHVVMYDDKISIREQISSSLRNKIKAAEKKGVSINEAPDLEEVYKILENEQRIKFGKKPTHSLEEFIYLHQTFPEEIRSYASQYEGQLVAGMTCFLIDKNTDSSFYLCIDDEYKKMDVLRPLVMSGLEKAQQTGRKYFDFGTSSINMMANSPVVKFKEEFTKSVLFREIYRWDRND